MQPYEQRRLSTPCSLKNVRRIASFVRDCCQGLMAEGDTYFVELAVVEAANNVVKHSYRDSEGWPIEIVARRNADRLEFLLADGGLPFNVANVPEPVFDWSVMEDVPESGRGIFLIRSVMDKVAFLRKGEINLCFLSKKFLVHRIADEEESMDPSVAIPFLCDAADPFSLIDKEDSPLPPPSVQAKTSSREDGVKEEMLEMLSLQSEKAKAFGKLAGFLCEKLKASGCALWLNTKRGFLEFHGFSGEIDGRREPIPLSSAELESQTAALKTETVWNLGTGRRKLCIPFTGIGRLLGVATLGFDLAETLEDARSLDKRELIDFVSLALENQLLYSHALDAEIARKEMEVATNLHKGIVSMLVPNFPTLSIYAKSQSAMEVGGDYLSFHKPSENVLWFMVCDAMGKGMSASFFSILAHMTFQSVLFIQDDIDPGQLITMSNRILSKDFDRFEMFMTALVGRIDIASKTMRYASAGHCPPIIYHPSNGAALLDTQDYMLGVDPDIEYKTFTIPFKKGMRLVAYTDGLTDIPGPDGEMQGVDPLLESCERYFKSMNVQRACEKIFSDALASSGGQPFDDMTLIGLESL